MAHWQARIAVASSSQPSPIYPQCNDKIVLQRENKILSTKATPGLCKIFDIINTKLFRHNTLLLLSRDRDIHLLT